MSMITELIKELRSCAGYINAVSGEEIDTFKVTKTLHKAVDVIEELSTKLHASQMERSSQYYHGGWIPCEERLPENDGMVLCWYEYYHWSKEKVLPEYGLGYCINGNWGGEVANGYDVKVLAWCPLPEQYQPNEEEVKNEEQMGTSQ